MDRSRLVLSPEIFSAGALAGFDVVKLLVQSRYAPVTCKTIRDLIGVRAALLAARRPRSLQRWQ